MIFGPDGKPADGALDSGGADEQVEVTRSFSYKHNLGNYESADFFCSAKRKATPGAMAAMSEALDLFCEDEVRRSLSAFIAARKRKLAQIDEQIERRAK